ncbi:MAG: hypothetical protein PHT40_02340 [Patescibacteria group bacterium]|nr:hypothetical protein [Patescibacteria group bacterium]
MLDLSGVQTVSLGKYDLSRIETLVPDEKTDVGKFLKHLLRHKQVMYDWGQHYFFTCPVPFSVDYDKKIIFKTDSKEPISDDQWIGCDPEELHKFLIPVFNGEWGPTATDIILRMERSGVKIELCGTKKFDPKNSKEFLERLRKTLVN